MRPSVMQAGFNGADGSRVVAVRGDVADGGGEGFLNDVEVGGVVAEHFGDLRVERQLVLPAQDVPSSGGMLAGGGNEMGVDEGQEKRIQSVVNVRQKA